MSSVIGVVAGLGPEGTVHYYRKLTQRFAAARWDRRPGIVLDHVWIDRFSSLLHAGADDESVALLGASLQRLHRAGADVAMIAAVTPHRFLARLRAASPVPILSIVEATCDDVLAAGHRVVGLLGTRLTLTERFFRKGLEDAGVQVVVPDEDGIRFLEELIFGPLAMGAKDRGMKKELADVVTRMSARTPFEALVVACTDLMDVLDPSLPLLDPIDSHVRLAARTLGVGGERENATRPPSGARSG